MLSFKKYIIEGGPAPVVSVDVTKFDMKNPGTILEINRNLSAVLAQDFVNPYAGYVKASKVLVNYGVTLPRNVIMDKHEGEELIVIHQFGGVHGAKVDGTITPPGTHDEESEHYFFFTYEIDEHGFYKCSAVIMNEDELHELMDEKEEVEDERGDVDPRQRQ